MVIRDGTRGNSAFLRVLFPRSARFYRQFQLSGPGRNPSGADRRTGGRRACYHAMIGGLLRGLRGCLVGEPRGRVWSRLLNKVLLALGAFADTSRPSNCLLQVLALPCVRTSPPSLQTTFSFFHPLVAINLSLSHSVPQSVTHLLMPPSPAVRRSLCISQGAREASERHLVRVRALGERSVQGSCSGFFVFLPNR